MSIMDIILWIRIRICWNSYLYSTLQVAGGFDVCDVIFEGRSREVWRRGEGEVNFSLKLRDVIYGRPPSTLRWAACRRRRSPKLQSRPNWELQVEA